MRQNKQDSIIFMFLAGFSKKNSFVCGIGKYVGLLSLRVDKNIDIINRCIIIL